MMTFQALMAIWFCSAILSLMIYTLGDKKASGAVIRRATMLGPITLVLVLVSFVVEFAKISVKK